MQTDYAARYSLYEEHHWWFRGRRKILRRILAREIPGRQGVKVLEIGVASGLNLYSLYPANCDLQGMEPDAANAKVAAMRGHVPVSVGTVENMPSELRSQVFDIVTMFDVLEHVQDDVAALRAVRARLALNGSLVLTVPAYQWMWGQQDMVNLHFRRYTKRQLISRLHEAGFQLRRATYFNTLLFPPIALIRVLAKCSLGRSRTPRSDFEYSAGGMHAWLSRLFGLEAYWLERYSFPFGVSLLAVAQNCQDGKSQLGAN
jgi:SAM-dependent methyltransferase